MELQIDMSYFFVGPVELILVSSGRWTCKLDRPTLGSPGLHLHQRTVSLWAEIYSMGQKSTIWPIFVHGFKIDRTLRIDRFSKFRQLLTESKIYLFFWGGGMDPWNAVRQLAASVTWPQCTMVWDTISNSVLVPGRGHKRGRRFPITFAVADLGISIGGAH